MTDEEPEAITAYCTTTVSFDPPPRETYRMILWCDNCDREADVSIFRGDTVKKFLKGAMCPNCSCYRTLRKKKPLRGSL